MHRAGPVADRDAQPSCLLLGLRRRLHLAGVADGGCNLAGVYFEKYVKGKHGQTLWIRNLQLSIYGVPLSILYTYFRDGRCVPGVAPKIPNGIGYARLAFLYTRNTRCPRTLPAMASEFCIWPPRAAISSIAPAACISGGGGPLCAG